MIMLISIATLKGFQFEIEKKISAVQGDFVIDSGRNIESGEPYPLHDSEVVKVLNFSQLTGVQRIIPSASKAVVLKSEEEIEGLIAKGVDTHFLEYFKHAYGLKKELKGNFTKGCWISETTASRLNVTLGQSITMVFFVEDDYGNKKPRARKLQILGIFKTGVDKIDGQFLLMDQEALNPFLPQNHSYTQIEIWLKPDAPAKSVRRELLASLPPGYLRLNSLKEYNRLIFDWLAILNTNVFIILSLMTLVAVITMGTTLLILIIEKTSTIGLFLALGAKWGEISRIFIYKSIWISLFGIFLGNLLTALIIWSQNTYHWISLNQEIYFIPYVVLKLNYWDWLKIDLGAVIVIAISMIIPSRFVRTIDIIKAIRFK